MSQVNQRPNSIALPKSAINDHDRPTLDASGRIIVDSQNKKIALIKWKKEKAQTAQVPQSTPNQDQLTRTPEYPDKKSEEILTAVLAVTQELTKTRNEISSISKKMESSSKKIAELQAKNEKTNELTQKVLSELAATETQLNAIQANSTKSNQELEKKLTKIQEKNNEKISELETAITSFTKQKEELAKKEAKLLSDIAAAEQAAKQAEEAQKKEAAKQEEEAKKQETAKLEAAKKEATAKLEQEAKLKEAQQKHAQAEAAAQKALTELETLNTTLTSTESELLSEQLPEPKAAEPKPEPKTTPPIQQQPAPAEVRSTESVKPTEKPAIEATQKTTEIPKPANAQPISTEAETILVYPITYGINQTQIDQLITKLTEHPALIKEWDTDPNKVTKIKTLKESILTQLFTKKEINGETYYHINLDLAEAQITDMINTLTALSQNQKAVIKEFIIETQKRIPMYDIAESIAQFRKLLSKENLDKAGTKEFEKQLYTARTQILAKINWLKPAAKTKEDFQKIFNALPSNWDQAMQILGENIPELEKAKRLKDLEELEIQLTGRLNNEFDEAMKRIHILEGKITPEKPVQINDGELQITLEKNTALMINTTTHQTAKVIFGDQEPSEIEKGKILFADESADMLKELGINIAHYSTIGKDMPYLKYLGKDNDLPEHMIAGEYYEAYAKWLKTQKNVPPQLHKQLNNIRAFWKTHDKAQKALCMAAMISTAVYMLARIVGVAGVMAFSTSDTAVLDRLGAAHLLIGEMAVRLPSSLQFSQIMYKTLSRENERFTATAKELEEVRGENGPPAGINYYNTTDNHGNVKEHLETAFLTKLGYWNFTAHHCSIGRANLNQNEVKSYLNEKEKLLNFIGNINKKFKSGWLAFENTLLGLSETPSTQLTFNKPLNIQCADIPAKIMPAHIQSIKTEYTRLAQIYAETAKKFREKEDYYRILTKEFTTEEQPNTKRIERVADIWSANARFFETKSKECLRNAEFAVTDATPETQTTETRRHLKQIREAYREYEHKFHHQIIFLFAPKVQKRMDYKFYETLKTHLESAIPQHIQKMPLSDVLQGKNRPELKELTQAIDAALKRFNCDELINGKTINEAADKLFTDLKKYKTKHAAKTISDILPQLMIDYFHYFDFTNRGKGEDQGRITTRFGKTFYLFVNADGKQFEIPAEEFHKFTKKYLGKSQFTQEEWDAITPDQWKQFSEIAKIFPEKPHREQWPETRFNYSMDGDYIPSSIDPDTNQRADFAESIVYQMRSQKEGQVNITVQQHKQNYLYDTKKEPLPGAANDDQKPWYGSFIFNQHIRQLIDRVQIAKETLTDAKAQDEYISIIQELATHIKVLDQSSATKLWPAASLLFAKKSTKGLTETELDQVLKKGPDAPQKIKDKIDYDLLNLIIGNIYRLLIEQRKSRGMMVGKDVDNGFFNCGTCRLEDVYLHRLAIQYAQIQNPAQKIGKNADETHALVSINNETGDIDKYLVRERTELAICTINKLVDLGKASDKTIASLLKTFLVKSKDNVQIKRKDKLIELFDKNGSRLLPNYEIKIENHPDYFAGIAYKRPKIFIHKLVTTASGDTVKIPHQIIYQYHKNIDFSLKDLEEIFGVQENRPHQSIGATNINSTGMIKHVEGLFTLKPGGEEEVFIFNPAIRSEADIDIELAKRPAEVREKVKKLFRKYAQDLKDIGTVVEEYTPSGKIVQDFIPRIKNTRYVTRVEPSQTKEIMHHTAGNVDITSTQIEDLLTSIKNKKSITIRTNETEIFVERIDASLYVTFSRSNGTQDVFKLKGNSNRVILEKNGVADESFEADDKTNDGVSIKYFSAAESALANKIKQEIAEHDFTVNFGEHNLDSDTFKDLLKNKHLLNRTITLGKRKNDTITFSGRTPYKVDGEYANGLNASFHISDAVQMSPDDKPSKKTQEEIGKETIKSLQNSETQKTMFIWNLLNTVAQNAEDEPFESNKALNDQKGFTKKGTKAGNIILRKNGKLKSDLRVWFAMKDQKKYLMIHDMVSLTEHRIPLDSVYNQNGFTNELIERLKKITPIFNDAQVDVVDLSVNAMRHLLKLRFADNDVTLEKTRDRSNLSLMLLNIKQLAPVGSFKLIQKVDGKERIHTLSYGKKVILDDIVYSTYEAAIQHLDTLLCDGSGDITIESDTQMPKIITEMIKTDDLGNLLFRRDMPTPKGTMPDWWITEDASSTFEQNRRGFKVIAAPYNFADGIGPDSMKSLYNQFRRWALGTMNSFEAEELKNHPTYMNTPAGQQLQNNLDWYKHGPLDDALFISPVALANSLLATEFAKINTFNPLAPEKSVFGSLTPFTTIIMALGLINVILNVLVYYNDMKDQPTGKKPSTSIKDIFIKESLIGFMGPTSYRDAYELDAEKVKKPFDVTVIGGEKPLFPYGAVKEVNTRLAQSIYPSIIFSSLYIKTLIAQGAAGMISPVGITCGLVGFWTMLNAAKMLVGIGAFEGFDHFWKSWEEGFKNQAENIDMKIHNQRAQTFGSLDNIEKSLAIAETRITERTGSLKTFHDPKTDDNAPVNITKANIGNISKSLDLAIKKIRSKDATASDTIKALNLILKSFTLAGQPKAGVAFIEHILYQDRITDTQLQDIIINEKFTIEEILASLPADLKTKINNLELNPADPLSHIEKENKVVYEALITHLTTILKDHLTDKEILSPNGQLKNLKSLTALPAVFAQKTKTIIDKLTTNRLTLTQFKKELDASKITTKVTGKNGSTTIITANGRPDELFKLIEEIYKKPMVLNQILKQSSELHVLAATAMLDVNQYAKAIDHLKSALENTQNITSPGKKARAFSRAEKLLIMAYQRQARAKIKDASNPDIQIAEHLVSPQSSTITDTSNAIKKPAAVQLLAQKNISKNARKTTSQGLYNTKHFNQANVLLDKFHETKNTDYLKKAYQHYAMLSQKSIEMEILGSTIIKELANYEKSENPRETLKQNQLTAVNTLLEQFYFTNWIDIKSDPNKSMDLIKLKSNKNEIIDKINQYLSDITNYLYSLKDITKNATTLNDVVTILKKAKIDPKLQEKLLNKLNAISIFLPDWDKIKLDGQNKTIRKDHYQAWIKNAVSERLLELTGSVNTLIELSDKNDSIKYTAQKKNGINHLSIQKTTTQKKRSSKDIPIKFIPSTGDTQNNTELWAKTDTDQETDLLICQQKRLLLKMMGLTTELKGINTRFETRLLKKYVFDPNVYDREKTGFIAPQFEDKKSNIKIIKDQVLEVVKTIISRLIVLERYDEALTYYSHFIPTLMSDEKPDEIKSMGDFIQTGIGCIHEQTKRDILKEYYHFLDQHGDQLTCEENIPLAFLKTKTVKDKKNKKVTEVIQNKRTVKEELSKIRIVLDNLMGEEIYPGHPNGHIEIKKILDEMKSKAKEKTKLNVITAKNAGAIIEFIEETDIFQANDIITYLREGKKGILENELYAAIDTIKPSLTDDQRLKLMMEFSKKLTQVAPKDKRILEIKTQYEKYFSTLIPTAKEISSSQKQEIQELIGHYLSLELRGIPTNIALVLDIYKKVLKLNPGKSSYFQAVTNNFQDQIEDRIANAILVLASKKATPADINSKEFDAVLTQLNIYKNILTNTDKSKETPGLNNPENRHLKACAELINASSKSRLEYEKMIRFFYELADLAPHYQANPEQQKAIVQNLNELVEAASRQTPINEQLAFKSLVLKANALISVQNVQNEWATITKLISTSQKEAFNKLPKTTQGNISLKLTEILTTTLTGILKQKSTPQKNKIEALALAESTLNNALNDTLTGLKIPDSDTARWELELYRFELRLLLAQMIEKKELTEESIKALRATGITGFSPDELAKFSASTMVLMSQKIRQIQTDKKECLTTKTTGYKLPDSQQNEINAYQKITEKLLRLIKEYNLIPTQPAEIQDPNQKQAMVYINKMVKTQLAKAVAFSNKIISRENNWDKIKFAGINNKTKFNEAALHTDVDKVIESGNAAKIPETPIAELKTAPSSAYSLWKRQTQSRLSRWWQNVKYSFKNKKLFLFNKFLNHAVLWGSMGLLAAIPILLFWPAAAAAITTVGVVSACTVGAMVVLPPIWHGAKKAYWSIQSTLKGNEAKKEIKEKI